MARLQRGRARREAERKEQRSPLMFWLRLVVAFVLVAILVVQVIRILDQSYWRQSELDAAIYRFGQTAMLANSEWLRAGRHGPVEVQLGSAVSGGSGQRSIWLHMNEQGWPLAELERSDTEDSNHRVLTAAQMHNAGCEALWRTLSQAPELLNVGLQASWHAKDGHCLFEFRDEAVFTYRLKNGHLRML